MTRVSRWLKLSEAQIFGIRFFAILIIFSVLAWLVRLPARLGTLQSSLAGAAAGFAAATGGTPAVHGDQIYIGTLAIDINYECTGVYVLAILSTFLLAYPASARARALGIALGAAALTAINVIRLAMLVRVAEFRPDLFPYMHEYVWQGLFLVLVITYAMAWVERVR